MKFNQESFDLIMKLLREALERAEYANDWYAIKEAQDELEMVGVYKAEVEEK